MSSVNPSSSADGTIAALSRRLASGETTARALAEQSLARINQQQSLNAFLHVDPALTLAEADAADRRIAAGESGPLLGVPIAHKDIFVTRGWRSTAGSKMLADYVSPFDATVVEKLRAAGMVCVG